MKTFKMIAASVALAIASASANAALTQSDVTTNQGTASITSAVQGSGAYSSLFFVAYNTDGSFSTVQSLGTLGGTAANTGTTFSIANTSASNFTFSLDNAANLASNSGTLQWGVYAYDTVGTNTVAGSKSFISTVFDPGVTSDVNGTKVTTAGIGAAGGVFNSFVALNTGTSGASILSTSALDVDNNWVNSAAGGSGLSALTTSITTTGAASDTLAMYIFANAGSANTNTASTNSVYAGTWSLNAATGTLSYAAASAVPVPAAAWLLLSGLGGLGVVGRRRKVKAA